MSQLNLACMLQVLIPRWNGNKTRIHNKIQTACNIDMFLTLCEGEAMSVASADINHHFSLQCLHHPGRVLSRLCGPLTNTTAITK